MSSLPELLLSCSTVFMQANNTITGNLQDVATVLSSHPWRNLDVIKTPDCGMVVVDESWLQPMTLPMVRSRMKASLVVSTRINEQILYFVMRSNKKLNFPVYIATSPDSQSVTRVTPVSPYDQNGKAVAREITGTYAIIPPYIINPTPPMPTGLDPAIMNLLSKQLNFKITYKFVPDFTELIKLVLLGQADMALSQPNFIHQRYRLGLDISPALTLRSFFFTKRHPVPVDSMYTISYPFNNTVWLYILVTIILIATVLTLFNRFYGLEPVLSFIHLSISYVPLVSESVPNKWFIDRSHNPHLIIMYVWLLFGFLLSQAYKSNLLANLVKVDFEKSPETFQDILDQNLEVYMTEGAVMTILLRDSPFEVHRQVFKEGVEKRGGYIPTPVPTAETDKRVQEGHAVGIAIDDGMAAYRHMYVFGKEALSTGYIGYYYSPKLPLKRELDKGLTALQESGIMQKLRNLAEWPLMRNERIMLRQKSMNEPVIIGMSHFTPMLIILVIGLSITALLFLPELIARKTLYSKRLQY